MPSSAKHVLLLCLKFTLQEFFQISLFTATRIILMNTFHRNTVWRLLSMAAVTAGSGGWWLSMRYSRSARSNNKRNTRHHHHHWLEAICVNNAFFYSKSCPFSTDIIGSRVFTWNSKDFALFHVRHSLPVRQVCRCGECSSCWFWCFRWRVITLRFYTEICLWKYSGIMN